jgi:hypothetical protein
VVNRMTTDDSPRSRGSYAADSVSFYRQSPFTFGTAGIFCLGPFYMNERLGDLVFVLG